VTIDTLFLVVVPVYLVLVAYGQVGARRRGLGPRTRTIAAVLRVALPPVALILALVSSGDRVLLASWGLVTAGMAVAGALVAAAVELVAPRVGA
jgi:hypothetical protein